MKITWNDLQEFLREATAYLAANKDRKSKLTYALEKVKTKAEKLTEKVREGIEDILTESYHADDKDLLVTDAEGRFRVTKEALKTRNKAQRDLMNSEVPEFEPYFASKVPENLTEPQLTAFTGFVITEAEADRIRKLQEAAIDSDSTGVQTPTTPEKATKENVGNVDS